MSGEPTQPHDYRLLLEAVPDLTIVGGQAINVWAITYLSPEQAKPVGYGSHDLDVLAKRAVADIVKALPDWKSEKRPLWNFTDARELRLMSTAQDGRILVVEVLTSVRGLDAKDLEATQNVEHDGTCYKVLDPVAILKAKAANIREIDQKGPPPRQDRAHLKLISLCVAPFLEDAHGQAVGIPELEISYARLISRTFSTLSYRPTLKILLSEGIAPSKLIPGVLRESPIEKVRKSYSYQIPRLEELTASFVHSE